MNDVSPVLEPKISNRLQSLDFVRGLTMVLLTLESTELYNHLRHATKGTLAIPITESFFSSSVAWFTLMGCGATGVHVR